MSRWGISGPPEEAYERITNPGRFLPLHNAALQLSEGLEQEYAVVREESHGRDGQLKDVELSRPSIRLVPASPASAPIVFVFTAFPSIILRFGRRSTQSFPSCGCDACDETAAEEITRLRQVVADVVGGRFREVIRVALSGKVTVRWEHWSEEGRSSGGGDVRRGNKLLGGSRKTVTDWEPWPRRA
jgi:hypothetical protein